MALVLELTWCCRYQPTGLYAQLLWGGTFEKGMWPNARMEPASLKATVVLAPPRVAPVSGGAGSLKLTISQDDASAALRHSGSLIS